MLNALKVAGVVLAGVARREAKAGTRLTLKLAILGIDCVSWVVVDRT